MQTIKEVLPGVLQELQKPEKTKHQRLIRHWMTIAGPKIAPHTKPSLGKREKLFVWVDQSTLAFELNQKYKQVLLKRVQAVLGEENVKSIFFRVGQIG